MLAETILVTVHQPHLHVGEATISAAGQVSFHDSMSGLQFRLQLPAEAPHWSELMPVESNNALKFKMCFGILVEVIEIPAAGDPGKHKYKFTYPISGE
jgi:hypothetical protein